MPLITFEAGQLPRDIKQELIEKITDLSAQVTGIPKEAFFMCIREMPDENIAIGGVSVKELKARVQK